MYDTQTGLRVFSNQLTSFLLNVPGNRFEYEMNCLLFCSKNDIKLHEIEIETIYLEKNKGTHFKALRDSYLIYKDIIKFSLSSIISFLIDYGLFTLLSFFITSLTLCNVLARLVSATCNYFINRNYVFKSHCKLSKSILLYILLAIGILGVNTLLLHLFVDILFINKYFAKIIVEIILFIFSFVIQNRFIFRK